MKLKPTQAAMLRKVVETNGGGVYAGNYERQKETRILRSLEALGLVQGKAGQNGWAVHTRDGLNWVRANPSK